MSAIAAVKDWLHAKTSPPVVYTPGPSAEKKGKVHAIRRWQAAKTDRLNESQWADANDRSMNSDLRDYRRILRQRIALEVSRNPIMKGVIETHVTDIVGPRGPRLQVRSKNTKYARQLEKLFADWWAMPDAAGMLTGPDKIRQWIRQFWHEGEFFEQKISSTDHNAFPRLRIQSIAPRRVETEFDRVGDFDWVMGVRRDPLGRPLQYSIRKGLDDLDLRYLHYDFDIRNAKDIIHCFDAEEPSQARGVPWAATQLQAINDVRHFDEELLNIMRKSAHFGIMLSTMSDQAQFLNLDEETEMEPNLISALPPHYTAQQIDPSHPTGEILSYREERLRELGLPVGMPGMLVRKDSSKHNYSSARFDALQYWRTNAAIWAKLERGALNPLVDEVALEGILGEAITEQRPDDVHYDWTWTKQPHVDPAKEAQGQKVRLESLTTSLRDEMSLNGQDWEEVLEQIARERKRMEELAIPLQVSGEGALESPTLDTVATDDPEALEEALAEISTNGNN